MKALAHALSNAIDRRFPHTMTVALDANLPFLDGFPLLPHLSHDDGKKLDIAFFYRTRDGHARGETKSPVGYWAFEAPRAGETPACMTHQGALRWNMPWLQPIMREDLELDEPRTRYALRWLASEGPRYGLGKVFVEPHLARRLGARGEVIRFQGCRAARHDDHIHLQLR
jgi:hypothetical protein